MNDTLETAFEPLRNALRPQGTAPITMLHLNSCCTVAAELPQRAIDEIIEHARLASMLNEPETACMKIAKMVLMDSAYMSTNNAAKATS